MDDKLNEPLYARDVLGKFQTVSTVPTNRPQNFIDQVVIYVSGSTYRLYFYDTVAGVWHYITATA